MIPLSTVTVMVETTELQAESRSGRLVLPENMSLLLGLDHGRRKDD
jgi:hypothetical protein